MSFKSINPKNGKAIGRAIQSLNRDQIEQTIQTSYSKFLEFRDADKLKLRLEKIGLIRKELEARSDTIAKVITEEMGKPITQSKGEVTKCINHCLYYEENSRKFLRPRRVVTEAKKCYVAYQPLGPILTIMPWNFPFWLPFKSCIPQLALGNTILLKPAPNVGKCAQELGSIMTKAGLEDEFKIFYMEPEDSEFTISHPDIRGISFTGSTRGGRTIAEIAGRHLKKCVLELGGSDPFIVLNGADLQQAAEIGTTSRFICNGQACINAKRFIVHKSVYKDFKAALIETIEKKVKVGDPEDPNTTLGPIARIDLFDNLKNQVKVTLDAGAKLAYGDISFLKKKTSIKDGLYFNPLVIEDIPVDSPAFKEELFGPVISLYKVSSDEEAVLLGKSNP